MVSTEWLVLMAGDHSNENSKVSKKPSKQARKMLTIHSPELLKSRKQLALVATATLGVDVGYGQSHVAAGGSSTENPKVSNTTR